VHSWLLPLVAVLVISPLVLIRAWRSIVLTQPDRWSAETQLKQANNTKTFSNSVPLQPTKSLPSQANSAYAGAGVSVGFRNLTAGDGGSSSSGVSIAFQNSTSGASNSVGQGVSVAFEPGSTPTPTPTPCGSLLITAQPQGQTVFINQPGRLSVTVVGSSPLSYQWYRGTRGDTNNPIVGATSSTFEISKSSFDRSNYWVRVKEACGNSLDSNSVRLTITDKRPLIFVPGIAGSVLVEDGNRELWPGIPCFYDGLTLDPGKTQPSVFVADVVRTALTKDIYETLITSLVSPSVGYRTGVNQTLFLFPYDWRKSNVLASGLLKTQIETIQSLFPGTKVDILAHSMGGMVAQRYVMDNSSAHHVNKLITIGTPWLGAPKALNVLETGQFLEKWGISACTGSIKTLAEYFKGMHELIPSSSYHNLSITAPFSESGWDINKNGNAFETYNYSQLVVMLAGRYLSDPGITNLVFHKLAGQDDGNLAPADISYYHLYGWQRGDGTITQVVAKRGVRCTGTLCFPSNYIDLKMGAGDGTVPIVSATRQGRGQTLNEPQHELIVFNTVSSSDNSKTDHVGLCSNPDVIGRIQSILSGPGLGANSVEFNAKAQVLPSESAYYLQVVGNGSIVVSDSAGKSATLTNDGVGPDIPGMNAYLMGDKAFMLVLATDQTYTVTLQSENEPLFISITKGTEESTSQALRYQDLNLPPSVKALLSFTPQGVDLLRYDGNGDGTFETVVNPTALVAGTAAQDTEAPVLTVAENRQSQNVTVVTVSATDVGSSVKKVSYSLDGTNYQTYSGTFSVDPYRTRKIYSFAEDNVGNRSSVIEFQLTATPPFVLVEQGTTNRAVALDSVTWLRSPFPVLNNFNFSADRHTRVILFISGLLLAHSDSPIVTVQASGITLPIESVGTVTGVSGLNASYIVVRLPDGLPAGELPLTIAVGGVVNTNPVTLGISP